MQLSVLLDVQEDIPVKGFSSGDNWRKVLTDQSGEY
jgi:hypothetical protein